MEKTLAYILAVALLLASLTACGKSQTDQQTTEPEPPQMQATIPEAETTPEVPEQTPAVPEPLSATVPVESDETEDSQPPEETASQEPAEEVQLFTDCNETVYATGTVNIRASYTAESEKLGSLSTGNAVTRTGVAITGTEAEGWSRVQLSDGSTAYISNKYLSTTKPVTTSNNGGGSTQQGGGQQDTGYVEDVYDADIAARREAFINGLDAYFDERGYLEGADHPLTYEEALDIVGMLNGGSQYQYQGAKPQPQEPTVDPNHLRDIMTGMRPCE